jgi:hypothetical protein
LELQIIKRCHKKNIILKILTFKVYVYVPTGFIHMQK